MKKEKEDKKCGWCNVTNVPLMKFGWRDKNKSVRKYKCRSCNSKTCRKHYEKHKEKVRLVIYESIRRQPEKQRARALINWRLKHGKIMKPKECSNCEVSDVRIVAHHPNYSKPGEIEWLCDSCHADRHKDMVRLK